MIANDSNETVVFVSFVVISGIRIYIRRRIAFAIPGSILEYTVRLCDLHLGSHRFSFLGVQSLRPL